MTRIKGSPRIFADNTDQQIRTQMRHQRRRPRRQYLQRSACEIAKMTVFFRGTDPEAQNGMANLLHANVTDVILRCFYRGGNKMGHGFLESVYQNVMYIELAAEGVKVKAGVRLPVRYDGRLVGDFQADLIVEDVVIVEIKAGRAIDPSATAQVINYLRASDMEVGLILNFGPRLEFRRIVFDKQRKAPAVESTVLPRAASDLNQE